MKKILALFIMLVFIFGLTTIAIAEEEVTLSFWSWRTEDIEAYEYFISEFNKEYPNININFEPYKNTEYNTILATALQGGGGPDIIHLRAYGGMEDLANAGYLTPLDDKVPELEDFPNDILAGAMNRRDGRVYGVPFAVQYIQVLYNKKMFNELGLEEPETWDEFLDIAQQVKDAGHIPFANGTKDGWTNETLFGGIAPTFYGGNDYYYEVVKGETTFEDPRLVKALEKMLELRTYLPENYEGIGYEDMKVLFAQEMAVMFVAGSYELGNMAQMNPDLEIGAFIVPGETKGTPKYNTIYVDGSYGINSKTKNLEEALKFIRFTATCKYGQMFTDTLKQPSAVPGVIAKDKSLDEIITISQPTPFLMLTAFRYGNPSGSTLLQNEVQAMMCGEQDIETTLKKIQTGIASWYEPFQN